MRWTEVAENHLKSGYGNIFFLEQAAYALPYEKVSYACRKICIKHLKENNLGAARAFFVS